jgi:hypothetical protein
VYRRERRRGEGEDCVQYIVQQEGHKTNTDAVRKEGIKRVKWHMVLSIILGRYFLI